MAGNLPLPGYNTPISDKLETIVDHPGPASYSNIATNGGTGDVLNASDFGLGGFEFIDAGMLSSDGLNYVWPEFTTGGNGNAVPTGRLRWIVLSTNAEVANGVNLSSKSVRLQIRGV